MTVTMRTLLLLATLLVAAGDALAQTCDASPIVVRNVGVWTRRGLVPNRDVFIKDGKVAAIQPSGGAVAGGPRVLDGKGHTLLPGLVDSHLHFTVPGGLPRGATPRTDTSSITARQLVMSGVTAGRLHLASLEEAVELRARAADACALIPRLQVGGPGISGAVEKDFPAFQGARSAADAIAKVAKFSAAGVDWIAIHDADRFAAGVLPALAEAARKAGIRLMAQGSTPAETLAALRINPDTLDYLDRTTDAGYRDEVIDRLRAAKNTVVVPTLGVPYRATQYRQSPARLEDAANFRFLSPADAAFVLANARKDLDARATLDVMAWAPTVTNKLKQLRASGVPMALGSDAGSTLHFQPNAIWWEMEAWRAAGVRHREVLIAATETGARVLRQHDIGYLRPGARADFVLYRGNVEEGPFDVERVIAVGKGGVIMR
jgi:imidazolonepropionase-like amidohydrolase